MPEDRRKSTLVNISLQMLEALREMHCRKYVHRDVKPLNFKVKEENHRVIITGFDISHHFMKEGRHTHIQSVGCQGSVPFASINGLKKFNTFRRDDLESLGYTLMTLMNPEKVPWKDFEEDREKTMKIKEAFLASPPPEFLALHKFIKKAHDLKYDEEPDYASFAEILKTIDQDR